ncbi:MAG: hypothetical protein CMQ38_00650 [Gammaproteobacteria bacterium]|nr:hypothetical protein [Gammaproteobacteria bacterium]|tara:strand:+ start:90 stop:359 length:270 start_codon:yes stop_codon:yes gene_type:complete
MDMQDLPPLGLYKHYKGKYYSVLGFARHSETLEIMVLYVPLYGSGGYWVRPLSMFTEQVEREAESVNTRDKAIEAIEKVPRFEYIAQQD